MPRKGENIYKRKDGRWEGRYIKGRDGSGKALYGYVYAKTYLEVRRKILELRMTAEAVVKSRKENLTAGQDNAYGKALFSEVIGQWLASVEPKLTPSSLAKYRNLAALYIEPYFGTCSVRDLETKHLETFAASLLASGGAKGQGLSKKTAADTLSVLKSILRYAESRHYRQDSLSVPSLRSVPAAWQDPGEGGVLSVKSQRQLTAYLSAHLSARNLGILLCLFTGMRIGELCALKWNDISFSEKTLHIHGTMQRVQIRDGGNRKTRVMVTAPKSVCSVRKIPLPDEVIQLLEAFPGRHFGYVLTGDEEKFLEPRVMENHLVRVFDKSKVERVNFHALRHTFATRCIELGFDVKSLSEILGHSGTTITMNRYVHPSMDLKRGHMQKLSGLFPVAECGH